MRALLLACLLLPAAAFAATGDAGIELGMGAPFDRGTIDESKLPALEQASGFIVDRTITNFGADFVRFFSQAWRDLPGTAEFDVTIVERPSARYGSLVMVEHDGRPVVRAFLYAGRASTIEGIATAAADYVARKLSDNALAGLLLKDPDLAPNGY